MVRGVLLPLGFSLSMEMCSSSRTMRNPKILKALTTFRLGASTGNFIVKLLWLFQQRRLPAQAGLFQAHPRQTFLHENESRIAHRKARLRTCLPLPQQRLL